MKLFKPIFKHWSFLADFIVIVAGILVAISLDNWNQDRQDRKLEQQYLEQLYDDFSETNLRLTKNNNTTLESVANMVKVINIIQDKTAYSADSLDYWLTKGRGTEDFRVKDGTYKSLINSGQLGIIRNDSLRSRLAEYQGLIDVDIQKLQTDWAYIYSLSIESFFMTELSGYGWISHYYSPPPGLTSTNRFPDDYSKLIDDKRFLRFCLNIMESRNHQHYWFERILVHNREIISLLEAELGIEPKEVESAE